MNNQTVDRRAPPTDATTLLNAALDAEPWAEPLTAWRRQVKSIRDDCQSAL